jgi:hypothetical protein
MNRVEPIAWAAARRTETGVLAARRVPTELLIVAVAMAGELLGALTNPLAGAALAIAAAIALTLRRIRADVRDLHAWEAIETQSAR